MWGRSNWRIWVVLKKRGIIFSRIKERKNLPKVVDISGEEGEEGSEGGDFFCRFIFWGPDGSNRFSGSF